MTRNAWQKVIAAVVVTIVRSGCCSAAVAQGPIDMGTTLVAIKYKDGVVVAADSRTSVSGYVSNRFAHKIAPVTDHCVVLRSGSAADTQQIAEDARLTFLHRRYRYGMIPTVSQVAHWIRSVVYDGAGTVSLMVAGYDDNSHSAHIYSISPSGSLIEEDLFGVSGSGSTYILGYLDDRVLADRPLDEDEVVELCKRAVELAVSRDGSSGGQVGIVVINAKGKKILPIIP
jgi:20S proteasome subunit beta 1